MLPVGTAPVASFPSNGWGFYDMNGNVYEWTEYCHVGLHPGASCEQVTMRGGAWYSDPDVSRTFTGRTIRLIGQTGSSASASRVTFSRIRDV